MDRLVTLAPPWSPVALVATSTTTTVANQSDTFVNDLQNENNDVNLIELKPLVIDFNLDSLNDPKQKQHEQTRDQLQQAQTNNTGQSVAIPESNNLFGNEPQFDDISFADLDFLSFNDSTEQHNLDESRTIVTDTDNQATSKSPMRVFVPELSENLVAIFPNQLNNQNIVNEQNTPTYNHNSSQQLHYSPTVLKVMEGARKMYSCRWGQCARQFASREHLKRHISDEHINLEIDRQKKQQQQLTKTDISTEQKLICNQNQPQQEQDILLESLMSDQVIGTNGKVADKTDTNLSFIAQNDKSNVTNDSFQVNHFKRSYEQFIKDNSSMTPLSQLEAPVSLLKFPSKRAASISVPKLLASVPGLQAQAPVLTKPFQKFPNEVPVPELVVSTTHQQKQHPSPSSYDSTPQMFDIPMTLPEQSSTSNIVSLTKLQQQAKKSSPYARMEKKYKCTFEGCNRRFTIQSYLIRHVVFHMPKVSTVCPVTNCRKTCTGLQDFVCHNRKHETNYHMRIYYCRFMNCGQRFDYKKELMDHFECHMPKEGSFKCTWTDCKSGTFDCEMHLRTHVQDHVPNLTKLNESFLSELSRLAQLSDDDYKQPDILLESMISGQVNGDKRKTRGQQQLPNEPSVEAAQMQFDSPTPLPSSSNIVSNDEFKPSNIPTPQMLASPMNDLTDSISSSTFSQSGDIMAQLSAPLPKLHVLEPRVQASVKERLVEISASQLSVASAFSKNRCSVFKTSETNFNCGFSSRTSSTFRCGTRT